MYRVASTLVVGDCAITQRGVITVGSSNSSDSNKWQHINTSAERDIIPLRSRLTVGDSYTDGMIF
ncbi:hypothetical protein DMI62_20975 [Escherichia coli]|nr:hypothetical protein [Escherichia coli]